MRQVILCGMTKLILIIYFQFISSFFFYYNYRMKEEKRKSMLKYLLSNNKNHPPQEQTNNNLFHSNAGDNQQQPQGTNKMEKSIKRIGTKQTIKSFHTNIDQNHMSHKNEIEHPVKINVLTKAKMTQDNEYNQKQFRKKLKRVGKKVWVTAYKQSVEQKQEDEQKKANLLNPNPPSDSDYFSEFKQTSINPSQFSNKSRCIDLSQRQDNMQSFLNISQDQKGTSKNNENISRQKQQTENNKQQKQYNVVVNKKQMRDREMSIIKQRNQTINTYYNNYNNFTQINDTHQQVDNHEEIDIEKVLEEIQNSHPVQKRKQSFKIKTCQSNQIIEIQSIKNINTGSKKRNSKFNKKQSFLYKQKSKNKQQDDEFNPSQQKNMEKQLQQSQMKSSKKPLLPAYPFNQLKQNVDLGIKIQKRSSNYRAKALQLKKQSSVNIAITEQKKGEKDQIKQMALQIPNRMIKSLNNSAHQKQNKNQKPLFQKIKTSEHYSTPKMTNSIKKSIKYYQMNKCIIQARKQLGKQHFYV